MTQTERLYALLKDGLPHRTDEILRVVYGSEHQGIARIGARVNDLKEGKWPGEFKCNIEGYKDPDSQALYFYKLIPPRKIELPPAKAATDPPAKPPTFPMMTIKVPHPCVVCGQVAEAEALMHRLAPSDMKVEDLKKIPGRYLGQWVHRDWSCLGKLMQAV